MSKPSSFNVCAIIKAAVCGAGPAACSLAQSFILLTSSADAELTKKGKINEEIRPAKIAISFFRTYTSKKNYN